MMKKVYLFLVPIVSYILAYFITDLETQIPLYSGSVLKIYVKILFFYFIGHFCMFLQQKSYSKSTKHTHSYLMSGSHPYSYRFMDVSYQKQLCRNFDNYFLVYFIYLGGYFNAAFVHLFQKGDTL